MPDLQLAGVRRKLDRAQHHFNDLHARIKTSLTAKPDGETINPELDEDGKTITLRLPSVQALDPDLPLIVGDCLHNLRSALDHLVFQLAKLNGATSKDATKTSFPVALTSAEFNRKSKNFAAILTPAALTAIEDLQPYKTSNPAATGYLWLLSQLDIIDKHRLLVVILQKFKVTGLAGNMGAGFRFSDPVGDPTWLASEEGAELLTIDFSQASTRPQKVNMNIQTATTVQFADTGLCCDGGIAESVLYACGGYVEKIVDDFGKRFFGE